MRRSGMAVIRLFDKSRSTISGRPFRASGAIVNISQLLMLKEVKEAAKILLKCDR